MSVTLQVKARYARLLFGFLCLLGLVLPPGSRSILGVTAAAAQSNRAFSVRLSGSSVSETKLTVP